jgi:hypothetical protein
MKALQNAYKKVIDSNLFQKWREVHKKAYLCSFFMLIGEKNPMSWQVDFYNPMDDTITSFLADDEVKQIHKDSKIFKPGKNRLNKLVLDNIKINLKEAYGAIENLKNEKYKAEIPARQIIILQNLKTPLWNITYMTTSFKLLNFKVDAITGDIMEEEVRYLFSLDKS